MKINLITPAKKHTKNGNRASIVRWAKFLRGYGHNTQINTEYDGSNCDIMIALHAWRSADAINLYKSKYPKGPLIVALGGTDVNTFLKTDPNVTLLAMEKADALVGLHDQIGEALPQHLTKKLHIIVQSAKPLKQRRNPSKRNFDICVIGHLRDEKDPLRTAMAVRLLNKSSKIRVFHLGKAHNEVWASAAKKEQIQNPRYHWLGEMSAAQVRREFIKTQLMVLSSNQEGGANVISEAIVAGVPIIASNIPGNTGLLGHNYPGLYPVRNEKALSILLQKAEINPDFLSQLRQACYKLKPRFTPEREGEAWAKVIENLSSTP